MAEANKDEVIKCKQIAQTALAAGDSEKAIRFLQKAKRMCPGDTSIDALLAEASSPNTGDSAGSSGSGPTSSTASGPAAEGPRGTADAREGPRLRASARASAGEGGAGTRSSKEGRQYTAEQMQLVQRILRTKDYYDLLEVPKSANEDTVKRAYKKLALKLHPDKNKAPGAEEAFKRLSKAVQCLQDGERRQTYDRYGDEERMPQHRHGYQEDFMTPEDLFAAFFGGPPPSARRRSAPEGHEGQGQRAQLLQALPVILLVLLTLASNFSTQDSGGRFSFTQKDPYRHPRTTGTLNVDYFISDGFSQRYPDHTQALADFERQVEVYHIRNLHSECDYQDKIRYNKVMMARRRGNEEDLKKARNHPRPACKEIERVKSKHMPIYRMAMQMGGVY